MHNIRELPSMDELRYLFDYDDKTGDLLWKNPTSNNVKRGDIAGHINDRGYRVIKNGKKLIFAHRVVWCFFHGYWPENEIDHINRNKLDNRISNIREVNRSCNVRNACVRKDNKSGVAGVSKNKNGWISRIFINGKRKFLGRFNNLNDAVLVRLAAELESGWLTCQTNSSAYRYALENNLIDMGGK